MNRHAKSPYITLDGGLITNDLDSIISILGKPVESGYDEMEDTNYTIFHIGEYRLKVDGNESGQVKWILVNHTISIRNSELRLLSEDFAGVFL